MLWPIRVAIWFIIRFRLLVVGWLAGVALGTLLLLREEQRTWAVRPADASRSLPGDDLVEGAQEVDTRSLRIAAPPAQVWPWLVQLGWGRGGWYSYDKLDMDRPSADTIVEELQQLAVGDIVPTHPGGGFVARVVEPERALVLYLDSELVQGQVEAAAGEAGADAGNGGDDGDMPAGLQAAGVLGGVSMPDFRASWAFVLEPEPDGSTRLIERLRLWTGDSGAPARLALPLMGLGVFLMTRRHMLGLKERAERLAAGSGGRPNGTPGTRS